MTTKGPKPKAVLISDIHYNLNTLELADAALNMAIKKANDLKIPLIVAGDLHDTKANLRAECVARLIDTFYKIKVPTYLIRGNHDSHNEKSTDTALLFLGGINGMLSLIDEPCFCVPLGIRFIPYHHDVEALRIYLKKIPDNSTIIMHQGLNGSESGEYIQDKSALDFEDVKNFRVISGHYHKRQDIGFQTKTSGKMSSLQMFSYIGNPYTLNFAESEDPEKGFQILMDDGSLEFVPTNLRKHVSYTCFVDDLPGLKQVNAEDLLKIKLIGSKEELSKLSRKYIETCVGRADFRLEYVYTDENLKLEDLVNKTSTPLMEELINKNATDVATKNRLKYLLEELLCD